MTVWPNGTQTMPTLTSPYGDPRPGSPTGIHNGADFVGFPTVRAVEAGVVKYAGWNDLMGNIVYASHAGDAYRTRSCHMAYTPTVKTGESFHQGDMFGVPGNTGSESRGVHLHFDVYLLGKSGWYRVDPVAFLNQRMGFTAGGAVTPFIPATPDRKDPIMNWVQSEQTGYWYAIYEFTATKITDHDDAVLMSHSIGRDSERMPSADVKVLLRLCEARAAAFSSELAAKVRATIAQEG